MSISNVHFKFILILSPPKILFSILSLLQIRGIDFKSMKILQGRVSDTFGLSNFWIGLNLMRTTYIYFYRTRYSGTGRLRATDETHAVPAASSPAAAGCGGFGLERAAASSWYHPRGRRRGGASDYGDYREGGHAYRRDDRG